MPEQTPLQLGAPLDIGDRVRTSLMLAESEKQALYSSSNPSQRADVCRVIQDRLTSSTFSTSLKKAVEGFNRSVTQDRRDLLIDKQTKFNALLEVAQEDLKKRFSPTTPQSKKTQIWRKVKSGLEKFSQVAYNYSSVMDVLVSAHPEIAALAWGAMKFLLAVRVNHQELKGKIVYHLAEIGEQFKIVDSYVRLFPEADMVEQVCGVYDSFTEFLRLSIDWCRENALVKFFKNVALPYEARIKPTVDELSNHMRKIKERVDVHNTHRLATMQYDIATLIGFLADSRSLQVESHAAIASLLRGNASDQKKQMDQQIEPIPNNIYARIKESVSGLSPIPKKSFSTSREKFPDLQLTFEHLKDCAIQSVRLEADHSYLAFDLPGKPEVKAWLGSKESALLCIDGFADSRASKWTTEFSVDVLLGAERQSSTALFYFGDIAMNDVGEPGSGYLTSPKAIIHSFIVQLLRQHAWLVESKADRLTPEHWTEARHSIKAAWNILHYLLQSLAAEANVVYIIIDSIDSLTAVNDKSRSLQPFLRRLSALVTSSPSGENAGSNPHLAVKILLTSVTGNTHAFLFPPDTARVLPSHSIVRIPQTFGQHNVASAPVHLRKPSAKRLVRLPDSDDEFGLKPADSFEFSDEEDEDMIFSSEEDMDESQGRNERGGQEKRKVCIQASTARHLSRKVKRTSARSESESSEDLDFSEIEMDYRRTTKRDAEDIQFSSSSEEESSALSR